MRKWVEGENEIKTNEKNRENVTMFPSRLLVRLPRPRSEKKEKCCRRWWWYVCLCASMCVWRRCRGQTSKANAERERDTQVRHIPVYSEHHARIQFIDGIKIKRCFTYYSTCVCGVFFFVYVMLWMEQPKKKMQRNNRDTHAPMNKYAWHSFQGSIFPSLSCFFPCVRFFFPHTRPTRARYVSRRSIGDDTSGEYVREHVFDYIYYSFL